MAGEPDPSIDVETYAREWHDLTTLFAVTDARVCELWRDRPGDLEPERVGLAIEFGDVQILAPATLFVGPARQTIDLRPCKDTSP